MSVKRKSKFVVGQSVVFISGDKGLRKSKKVFTISALDGEYVTLDGYTRKKSQKITESQTQNFIDVPVWVHASNLGAYDASESKVSRVGFKKDENGKLVRFFKKTGNLLKAINKSKKNS